MAAASTSPRPASRGPEEPLRPPPELILTSHGVAVSPWIASLPCCCRGLLLWVYCETLRPGDTFAERLRKVVLSGAFCGTSISVVSTAAEIASGSTDVTTTVGALSVADSMILAASWMSVYAYTRCTGNASAVCMDLFFAAAYVAWVVAVISSTEFPLGVAVALMLVLVQLSRTPRLPLHVLVLSVLYVVSAWNHSAFHRSTEDVDHALLGLSEMAVGDGKSRFFGSVTALVGCLLVLLIVRAQVSEADRQVRETAAHAELATSIATLLGDFDTAQARADIDAAEAKAMEHGPAAPAAAAAAAAIRRCEDYSGGSAAAAAFDVAAADGRFVDPAGSLFHSFRVLVRNLETYRPHLPNWLVNRHIAGEDGAEDDVTVNGMFRSTTVASNTTATARTEDTDSTAAMRKGGASSRRGSSAHSGSSARLSARAALTRIWLHPAAMTKLAIAMAHVHFRVATMAEIRGWGAPPSGTERRATHRRAPEKHRKSRHASTLSAFVDIVTDAASSVGAALHTLMGDVAIVSCNAASRAVHPELKMARFAVRLQNAVADHNSRFGESSRQPPRGDAVATTPMPEGLLPIVIGGAIGAGKAEVTLAGSADKAQHVLIDATKWLPAMRRNATAATDSGLVVADQRMACGVELFISAIPLGHIDTSDDRPWSRRSVAADAPDLPAEPAADDRVPPPLDAPPTTAAAAGAEPSAVASSTVKRVCLYALLTEIEASAVDGDAWFLSHLDPNASGDDAAAPGGARRATVIAKASGLPTAVVAAALASAPSAEAGDAAPPVHPRSDLEGGHPAALGRALLVAECSDLLDTANGRPRTQAGRLAQMMLRLSE